MLPSIPAIVRKGKIILTRKISLPEGDVRIKIFAFPPLKYSGKNVTPYFGKLKGIFGDGLKFQQKLRNEWN